MALDTWAFERVSLTRPTGLCRVDGEVIWAHTVKGKRIHERARQGRRQRPAGEASMRVWGWYSGIVYVTYETDFHEQGSVGRKSIKCRCLRHSIKSKIKSYTEQVPKYPLRLPKGSLTRRHHVPRVIIRQVQNSPSSSQQEASCFHAYWRGLVFCFLAAGSSAELARAQASFQSLLS